jgi:hypothetical protein
MTRFEENIVKDFVDYINQSGGNFTEWYVGIASDARSRLFQDHGVNEESGLWLFDNAMTLNCARNIQQHLVDTYKMQGDTSRGEYATTTVYAYKVVPTTKQESSLHSEPTGG